MSNFWTWWTSPYTPSPSEYPYAQIKYWDYNQVAMLWGMLQNAGLSDNACAGLFGNLHWESGICPMKCEGLAIVDRSRNETINRIIPASRSEFISQNYGSGTGYSLAQWSYTRKGDYYDWPNPTDRAAQWAWLATENQMIRDGNFLIHDLQTFSETRSVAENLWSAQGKTVWQWLTDPNVTLYDALQAVLMIFEKPFQTLPVTQSAWNEEWHDHRLAPANDALQNFAGITPPPVPPTPPTPPTPTPGPSLPIWLYFKMKEMNSYGK